MQILIIVKYFVISFNQFDFDQYFRIIGQNNFANLIHNQDTLERFLKSLNYHLTLKPKVLNIALKENSMETQLKKPSTNSVGNWTPQEDEVILRYVYEKGKGDEHMMWGNLSETLNGRSGKSCRERWFNHLDPKIKRTEWSQEEQWVLFILRNQSNEKWSLISKKLMGRTDNAVKNYWNSRLKKRIDSMQHAVN